MQQLGVVSKGCGSRRLDRDTLTGPDEHLPIFVDGNLLDVYEFKLEVLKGFLI